MTSEEYEVLRTISDGREPVGGDRFHVAGLIADGFLDYFEQTLSITDEGREAMQAYEREVAK